MNLRNICILLLGVVPAVFATADYCDPKVCPRNKKHIACHHNHEFGPACGPNSHLVNLTDHISQILNKHNSLRHLVAGGFEHLPPADHMATMEWDDELAELAGLNVKQCEMEHDDCRSTDQYRYAGQNLAMAEWSGYDFSLEELIDQNIQGWFDEYKFCPVGVIKRYPKKWTGEPIGHFTAMVQQKSNRIGCALARDDKDGKNYQFFACNYAITNIIDNLVYSVGPAGSKCAEGNNPEYPNLCSTSEVYNLK